MIHLLFRLAFCLPDVASVVVSLPSLNWRHAVGRASGLLTVFHTYSSSARAILLLKTFESWYPRVLRVSGSSWWSQSTWRNVCTTTCAGMGNSMSLTRTEFVDSTKSKGDLVRFCNHFCIQNCSVNVKQTQDRDPRQKPNPCPDRVVGSSASTNTPQDGLAYSE